MPDWLEQLDLLLVQVAKARQVRVDAIHFKNLRYISTTLAAYVGETVTLRFDPRDMVYSRRWTRNQLASKSDQSRSRSGPRESRDRAGLERAARRRTLPVHLSGKQGHPAGTPTARQAPAAIPTPEPEASGRADS